MTGLRLPYNRLFLQKIAVTILASFLYSLATAQPVISSFSPSSGPVGSTVIISGSGFSTTTTNNIVYFGAVKAVVTAATANSLTVTVPSATTFQPVSVSVNNLTTFTNAPFIITFSGASPEFTPASFEYTGHVDSQAPAQETTKFCYGDFDDDGKLDVAVVDRLSNILSVYRNTTTSGAISFAPKVTYVTGTGARAVSAGDVDGDGKTDLVVSNNQASSVSVYRNITSGSILAFTPKTDFTTATQPSVICITDIDKDGKSDLVVNTINLEGFVSVLRNTGSVGNLSFAPKVDLQSGGGSIENISVADLDGDGKKDILLPNFLLNAVSVFRNTSIPGTLSFAAKQDFIAAGTNPDQLEVGDLNNDNRPDLVMGYYLSSNNISVFSNISTPGNISFITPNNFSTSNLTGCILINDFNGDSKPDLAVASGLDSVSLFRNISSTGGTISFAPRVKFQSQLDGVAASGDFDGDGKPDIMLRLGVFTAAIFKNRVTLPQFVSFTPASAGSGTTVTINGANFTGATAVSFGGIPAASFTVVNQGVITAVVGAGASGDISITTPIGSCQKGTFTYVPAPQVTSFTPLIAASGQTVTITGTNFTATTAVTFGGTAAASFNVVDANTITAVIGTGATGNVVVTTAGGIASLAGFTYLPPPGISSFTPATGTAGTTVTITGINFINVSSVKFGGIPAGSFTLNSSTSITAIVLDGATGAITITTPGGTATATGFTYTAPPVPVITGVTPLSGPVGTVVTISGNNFNTIAQNNTVYFGPVRAVVSSATANSVTVTVPQGATYQPVSVTSIYRTAFSPKPFMVTFPGGGGISPGSFEQINDFPVGNSPNDLCLGDFDGDGKSDVAVANYGSGKISVLLNTGTPGIISFAPRVEYVSGNGAWQITSADADGDGKLDLWVLNKWDKSVSVFRNTSTTGNASFEPLYNYAIGGDPFSITYGDLDQDGKTDMIVGDVNVLYVIRNNGYAGNISFEAKVAYPTGFIVSTVSTGDIDGDGRNDIVLANSGNDSVSVLRNTTISNTISFAPRVSYAVRVDLQSGYGPYDLFLADMDSDGKSDIVTANNASSHSISILKNNSTPGVIQFPSRSDFMTDNIIPLYTSVNDLDGDGKPDVAVIHEYVPASISLLKNSSIPGAFSMEPHVDFTENANSNDAGIVIGDLDGDNKPEVITTYLTNAGPHLLSIFRNKTDGPHITGFSPANGLSGTTVTITGLNFTGVTSVSFGGVPAASFVVNSATSITAVLGAGATGAVKVTTPKGTVSKPGFFFGLLPHLTSFTPSSGSSGTLVNITGTNLSEVTQVYLGNTSSSFVINSSTSITATVFTGSTGYVRVVNPGGADSLPGFTYIPPIPVISSFSPVSASVGTSISIWGSNFIDITSVKFGGVPASSFSVTSQGFMTAVVGNGNSGDLTVTNGGGTATKSGFTLLAPPVITSFSPVTAATGTTVTITGTNFTGASSVMFGGVAATSYTVISATSITAVVGNGNSGNVSVTTAGGTASFAGFNYIPAPTITSFTPVSGSTGTTITITGTNFTAGATVSFGGTPATSVIVMSPVSINAVVANGSSGNVTVTTAGGTASLAGFNYTIVTAVGNPGTRFTELTVSPNPGDERVLVKYPATSRNAYIQFTDIAGRTVFRVKLARNSRQTEIRTEALTTGIYFISWTDERRTITQVFYKN